VDAVVRRLAENPLQFPAIYREAQRACQTISLRIVYVIEDDRVTVIACFHASRDPGQWQRRD
jgi:plasmid stabilization system protein ParE